jgi:hypothetical protein
LPPKRRATEPFVAEFITKGTKHDPFHREGRKEREALSFWGSIFAPFALFAVKNNLAFRPWCAS